MVAMSVLSYIYASLAANSATIDLSPWSVDDDVLRAFAAALSA
jgi:hypothetical protein